MKETKNTTSYAKTRAASTAFGRSGTVTGRLHWDPLVYPCRDGSRNYLFQVDTAFPIRDPASGQMLDAVQLKAHVPAGWAAEDTPFGEMRRGSLVTARFVVRTDTYYDAEGNLASKTYLYAESLTCHGKETPSAGSSSDRNSGVFRQNGGGPGQGAYGRGRQGRQRREGPSPAGGRQPRRQDGGTPPWNGRHADRRTGRSTSPSAGLMAEKGR